MTDRALQRLNMVESQIRPSDVTDRRILRAMAEIPRERFVPEALADLAYMDELLPVYAPVAGQKSPQRALLSPRTFAKLIQLAVIAPTDSILDVGSGRGYSAAVLARLGGSVAALECDETLAAAARAALDGDPIISITAGPLEAGLPSRAPFDVIVLEGGVDAPPATLLAQLGPGGRLVAVLRGNGIGQATVWRRTGDHLGRTTAFEAAASPLPGFERPHAFVF
jgi:protein-L-isoaspartate(D-aspartate) O-methyltransferase